MRSTDSRIWLKPVRTLTCSSLDCRNRTTTWPGGASRLSIANIDSLLACTKVNNNTVRLAAGAFSNQGYIVCVPGGQTADLTVTSGTSGQYRKDYVVAEFVRGGGAVADAHVFMVIAGTPAASAGAAAYPTLTQNNLATGGTTRQEPLYGLLIEGTTLNATITRIAPLSGTYA